MKDADCPTHVQAFVASHIDSVVQLEVLLVFCASPDREWMPESLARELRIDPAWVDNQLARLCQQGLLHRTAETPHSYQYRPQTPALHQAVTDLAKAYADRRVTVISLIYSKPPAAPSAAPADPLKSFSDAFRLRKDNRNG